MDVSTLRLVLREKVDRELSAYLDACVRCGLCASSCHYSLTDSESLSIPGYKLNRLGMLHRKFSRMPRGSRRARAEGDEPTVELLKSMVDVAFGRCTMCARCSLHCSIGIDVSEVVHRLRGVLAQADLIPNGLASSVQAAEETGNSMRITRDEWMDTIRWLEEDLRLEVSDEKASMPLDKQDSRILYAVNPREPKFFPLSLSAAAKVFYAADEDWTLSSRFFDITNYSYFAGDDERAARFSENLFREAERLGAQYLVLSECGHGYYAARWHVPSRVRRKSSISVKSILEVIWDYIRSGRIKVDTAGSRQRVTLHDPCHLVRKGGIIREPREILKRVVSEFVEMTPNSEKNFCCSGGGGSLSMTVFAEKRRNAGRVKAEQINKTGAEVVASPCHNCVDQLQELDRHYELGVKVKTVTELVADALILPKRL